MDFIVHEVAKSQIGLSNFHFHFHGQSIRLAPNDPAIAVTELSQGAWVWICETIT